MNKKTIIGVVIVIIILIVVGVVFVKNRNNSSQMKQMKMNMNMPMATQSSQTKTHPANGQVTAGKDTVTIKNFAFSPATITIKAGDSVTWTNQDSVGHSATADDNSFDTGVLSPGQSKSILFSKPGTYTYHCSVHPEMKATVIVQ